MIYQNICSKMSGKPLIVMFSDAKGREQHKTKALFCHLGTNLLALACNVCYLIIFSQ